MPNSSDVSDHDLSAIEAAIRETARGRAFLASYARRVRQSDTMTLLAMLNRLEHWCWDQATRFTELDGRALVGPGGMPAAGGQDGIGKRRMAGELQRSSAPEASDLADEIHDPLSIIDVRNDYVEQRPTAAFLNQGAMRRLEEVAATLSELDRRTTDLAARFGGEVSSPKAISTGHSALDHDKLEAIASTEWCLADSTDRKTPVQDTNVLDLIAKALGSVA